MPVTVPFSKSTVFKICRQKMCRFRVNGRPIRRIFHRFQNVPASCERSLIFKTEMLIYQPKVNLDEKILSGNISHFIDPESRRMLVKCMFRNKDSTFHSGP